MSQPSSPPSANPMGANPIEANPVEGADQIEAAWADTKLAQVLYHDWEADSYDKKWSISFDERCINYARDRFATVAGADGWPYRKSLEIGAGTGFFTLNLMQAGVISAGEVSDISAGMVGAAKRNAERLGLELGGKVGDAESLPYEDDSFDLVIGHAVIHHLPDIGRAFAEIRRVLRPGGRVVICGEPTRWGDAIARRLSRATWRATTNLTRLRPLRGWARPRQELDESSRAAALEAVVDLHTFDPGELAATVRSAGLVEVSTVTEELTAAWVGWPIRTFEAAIRPERLGWGWRMFAYRAWVGLSAVDRLLNRIVPDELYYNVSVTGVKPPSSPEL